MAIEINLEFLKNMDTEAKNLAAILNSPDYWAKPFYSDVHLFRSKVPRIFLGLNGAGDRFSKRLDEEDNVNQQIWSGDHPYFNSHLDERWGTQNSGSYPKGEHALQSAVQRVFQAMYAENWETVLRNTPCFNLIPVSSRGAGDPELKKIWDVGAKWGIQMIEFLEPKLIILSGNGEKGSPWSEIKKYFNMRETHPPVLLENPTFSVKRGVIRSGTLKDTGVIGMPHLSHNKGTVALLENLSEFSPYP